MSILKQKTIVFLSVILLCFSLPALAEARGLVPCGGYADDLGQQREKPCRVEDIFALIGRVTNWLLSVVGLFAVYNIIASGFYLAISDGDEEKITQKKKALSNSVVGFVLALMAFMFVNTVVNYLLLRAPAAACRLN